MLLALPKPLERVERIPVQKVFEQRSRTSLSSGWTDDVLVLVEPREGWLCMTGDGSVVHVSFSVNHQIDDPVLYTTVRI